MVRLTSPTGVTVNVGDDKAAQLTSIGYTAETKSEPKAPAKKATSSTTKKKS
jgi:hypothetical protein